MAIPGFRISIHQSLTVPILMAGVPRTFAIVNGTICAAFTLGLHTWESIPICALAHVVASIFVKKDPHFFECMLRHIKQKSYYEV